MDITRCSKCNKRLAATTERTGRTELKCPKCDEADHMKTEAAKWADTPWFLRRGRPNKEIAG
jgi:phage FluMu protein Com